MNSADKIARSFAAREEDTDREAGPGSGVRPNQERHRGLDQNVSDYTEQKTPRIAQQAILVMESALRDLEEKGDTESLDHVALWLNKNWIGADALSFEIGKRRIADARDNLPRTLATAARQASCEFRWEPPFARFGCVTLQKRKDNEWTLTVSDSFRLQSLNTSDGNKLARACLRIIQDIEQTLKECKDPLRDLEFAIDLLQGTPSCNGAEIPLNLLMLLMPYGRESRKALANPQGVNRIDLSRPAFGFLVAAALRAAQDRANKEGTSVRWTLRQAPQLDTRSGEHRFVSVPMDLNPRTHLSFRPCVTVLRQPQGVIDAHRA